MYKTFFGLRADPFNVNPDPQYLYVTKSTREALTKLTYGIQNRKGFILLTGEVGTGKTTLLNQLLAWLNEQAIPSAFIFNSQLRVIQLFDFIMADFGIPCESREKSHLLIQLNEWLLERYRSGKTCVLVVDEAQSLSLQVLEEIRLLTNLETPNEKLLQIVLSGQPELEEKLKRPELRQLRQRIVFRCRTNSLSRQETRGYIAERLRIAGSSSESVFSEEAMDLVHQYARGIPRLVNLLCEHALINAFVDQQRLVLAPSVEEAARELQLDDINSTAPLAQSPGDQAQPLKSVTSGEIVVLANRQSGADVLCPVANVKAQTEIQPYADLEYTQRTPGFRGDCFPTDRSTGSEAPTAAAVSQAAVVVSPTTTPKPAVAPESPVESRSTPPAAMSSPEREATPVSLPTAEQHAARAYSQSSSRRVLEPDSDLAWLHSTPAPAVLRAGGASSLREGSSSSKKIALVASAAVALLGLVVGFMLRGQVRPQAPVPHQEAATSARVTVPPVAPQQREAVTHSTTQANVATAITNPLPRAQGETKPMSVPLPVATSSVNEPAPRRANIGIGLLQAPVLKSSSMTRASEPPPVLVPQSSDVAEAELAIGLLPGAGSGNAPAPPPAGDTHVAIGGQMQVPKLLSSPPPAYPARARAEGVQGTVVIEALVDVTGKVTEMTVISGHPLLRDAALAALQTWTYQPARLNGQPIAVQTRVSLHFGLN